MPNKGDLYSKNANRAKTLTINNDDPDAEENTSEQSETKQDSRPENDRSREFLISILVASILFVVMKFLLL